MELKGGCERGGKLSAASGNKPQKLTSEEEKTLCVPLLSPNFFERRKSNKVTFTSIYYRVCNMYVLCVTVHTGMGRKLSKGMFLIFLELS